MIHKVSLETKNLHGSFSKDYQPTLTINSGDSLHLTTPDIEWGYSEQKGKERTLYSSRVNEEKRIHPMIGPIEIQEAKKGMVLEVRLNEISPGWYGRNWGGGISNWQNEQLGISNCERIQLDWELNAQTMTGSCYIGEQQFHVGLKPFMGLLAVAPAEPGVHITSPPRYCGGNIDCKELVKGSTLYLPIAVDGALFSIGDGHALQGDGEVSGTAIECPMDFVDVTLTIREDMELRLPRAKTPTSWITFGFDEDLNKATAIALNEMVEMMQQLYQIGKAEATALASVAVDLRVTQIVNGVKGVHAILPHGALRG
ncbi:acetamidase/formamidase family protein [Anaerobacillus sp. CMMVII]|uniref:acetamidase/formamidase family protein n=1 Tax=Anaerobacillus sp. CMMVII TaxID=2755588 RepID=UPI0021B8307C|nr:acetamidase/formamidase family protein [Anaerobacillus sp. CMMVII]MCT8138329.1 acetamidase/formamidase family protein [Anaerobacillus sp. CMMVII]